MVARTRLEPRTIALAGFCEGRQELLLILEEYWERCPEMRGVPIYQASGLARRGLSVYQTYIEMMNEEIKAAFQVLSPARPPCLQPSAPGPGSELAACTVP